MSTIEIELRNKAIIIAGQAASHCVKASADDFMTEIRSRDPGLLKKVYIMTDCMSAVTVPDGKGGFFVDYTSEAEAAIETWRASGANIVKSTDPMDSWPGMAAILR